MIGLQEGNVVVGGHSTLKCLDKGPLGSINNGTIQI